MSLLIYDELSGGIDSVLLDTVYATFLKRFELDDVFDVEVAVVDEITIKEVNKHTRSVDDVTDVLSFPNIQIKFPFKKSDYEDCVDLTTGNIIFGEIMLCQKRASEQAEEFGHSFQRECAYLFLHGLLHLTGFDHTNDEEKKAMREVEEEILNSLKITRESL